MVGTLIVAAGRLLRHQPAALSTAHKDVPPRGSTPPPVRPHGGRSFGGVLNSRSGLAYGDGRVYAVKWRRAPPCLLPRPPAPRSGSASFRARPVSSQRPTPTASSTSAAQERRHPGRRLGQDRPCPGTSRWPTVTTAHRLVPDDGAYGAPDACPRTRSAFEPQHGAPLWTYSHGAPEAGGPHARLGATCCGFWTATGIALARKYLEIAQATCVFTTPAFDHTRLLPRGFGAGGPHPDRNHAPLWTFTGDGAVVATDRRRELRHARLPHRHALRRRRRHLLRRSTNVGAPIRSPTSTTCRSPWSALAPGKGSSWYRRRPCSWPTAAPPRPLPRRPRGRWPGAGNPYGQVGDSTLVDRGTPQLRRSPARRYKALSGGASPWRALNGTVWTGSNWFGRPGNGDATNATRRTGAGRAWPNVTTCSLDSTASPSDPTGTVWSWGWAAWVSSATARSCSSATVPVQVRVVTTWWPSGRSPPLGRCASTAPWAWG